MHRFLIALSVTPYFSPTFLKDLRTLKLLIKSSSLTLNFLLYSCEHFCEQNLLFFDISLPQFSQ